MPGVTVHLHFAQSVLRRSLSAPRLGTPRWSRPHEVNAFRMGALGPDLGYMPGGFRPLSDLAHCLRTADLARALIARSRTPTQRAFAAGWLTHVLADTLVHPLVGYAVGEVVEGSQDRFVDGDQAPAPHAQVEVGLDVAYAARYPTIPNIRLEPVFGRSDIAFLAGAFERTYGVAPAPSAFLRSHRLSARRGVQALKLAALLGCRTPRGQHRHGTHRRPRRAWHRLRATLGGRCVALAFLLPVPPTPWLLDAVEASEVTFLDRFLDEWSNGGAGLRNVNLDTGRPDLDNEQHGGLRRTLTFIERLGGQAPVLTGVV